MEAYALSWIEILLRCLHIITGIAWIGASFYFVWLDNHLRKPVSKELKDKGVDGELWAVHGGGFYNPQKYMVAPKELPEELHWFYWESYSTWMSGFALFVTVYLMNAKTMMLDPKVASISAGQAVAIALGILVIGWVVYDVVCRMFQARDRVVGFIVSLLVIAVSYVTCHLFSARAAFLVTGAMMATVMTANVFFWIIPGQRAVIKSMRAGEAVNPIHGQRGKQRSVHNTYFTLPVLFAMMSNHFHMIYADPAQWILLVLMMAAGVLVRHYFVLRHKGRNDWWFLVAATAVILGVAIYLAPSQGSGSPSNSQPGALSIGPAATISDVEPIIKARCQPCHSAQPMMVAVAPKNIKFDDQGAIEQNAMIIYMLVVKQRTMPLGNATEMTEAERQVIQSWYEAWVK
jgi:uncharacterized membrane protein